MTVKQAERIAVFGRSGSGKSTIVKRMMAEQKSSKIIVFDVMDEYTRKGWIRVENIRDCIRMLKKHWKKGFKIAFVPKGNFAEQCDKLAKLVWELQGAYGVGDTRQFTLVIEEANEGIPNRTMPAGMDGMQTLATRGRHRGINVIAVSQRPALVHTTFRGNCNRTFVFALANEIDRKQIIQTVGNQYANELRQMPEFQFWVLQNGQKRSGRTTASGRYSIK